MSYPIVCPNHYLTIARNGEIPEQYPNTTSDVAYGEGWRLVSSSGHMYDAHAWICPSCVNELVEKLIGAFAKKHDDEEMAAMRAYSSKRRRLCKLLRIEREGFLLEIEAAGLRYRQAMEEVRETFQLDK